MAPNKSLVLLAALLLAAAVGPAVGLIPSLTGIAGNPLAALSLISGVVPCSIGSAINVAVVPPFANASLQVLCGSTVVANATTNSNGAFAINLGLISAQNSSVATSLLSGQCSVVVTTPLVACNASLAGVTGTLGAPLQLLGSSTSTGGVIIGSISGFIVTTVNGVVNHVTGLFSVI